MAFIPHSSWYKKNLAPVPLSSLFPLCTTDNTPTTSLVNRTECAPLVPASPSAPKVHAYSLNLKRDWQSALSVTTTARIYWRKEQSPRKTRLRLSAARSPVVFHLPFACGKEDGSHWSVTTHSHCHIYGTRYLVPTQFVTPD